MHQNAPRSHVAGYRSGFDQPRVPVVVRTPSCGCRLSCPMLRPWNGARRSHVPVSPGCKRVCDTFAFLSRYQVYDVSMCAKRTKLKKCSLTPSAGAQTDSLRAAQLANLMPLQTREQKTGNGKLRQSGERLSTSQHDNRCVDAKPNRFFTMARSDQNSSRRNWLRRLGTSTGM